MSSNVFVQIPTYYACNVQCTHICHTIHIVTIAIQLLFEYVIGNSKLYTIKVTDGFHFHDDDNDDDIESEVEFYLIKSKIFCKQQQQQEKEMCAFVKFYLQ